MSAYFKNNVTLKNTLHSDVAITPLPQNTYCKPLGNATLKLRLYP
jgi:hypothetical protein